MEVEVEDIKEVIILENDPIISVEEQNIIIEWTKKNYNRFLKTGFNRQMIGLHLVPKNRNKRKFKRISTRTYN